MSCGIALENPGLLDPHHRLLGLSSLPTCFAVSAYDNFLNWFEYVRDLNTRPRNSARSRDPIPLDERTHNWEQALLDPSSVSPVASRSALQYAIGLHKSNPTGNKNGGCSLLPAKLVDLR